MCAETVVTVNNPSTIDQNGQLLVHDQETAMIVLHTGLGFFENAVCGWFPAILFFGQNTGRLVFTETFRGYRGIALVLIDFLEPLMEFLCPVSATVLD